MKFGDLRADDDACRMLKRALLHMAPSRSALTFDFAAQADFRMMAAGRQYFGQLRQHASDVALMKPTSTPGAHRATLRL